MYSIDRATHLRAVLLTQLIHNVDWKGEVNVEMSPFDIDVKKKEKVTKMVMEFEEKYYDEKY